MMTPAEEAYALDKAYVPEHIVSLMVAISQAEAFLIEDRLSFVKDNWLIVVGYPLDRKFPQDRCEEIVKLNLEKFQPETLWFIGSQVPTSILESCTERESDQYYQLDLAGLSVSQKVRNMIHRAERQVKVEKRKTLDEGHRKLVLEFLTVHPVGQQTRFIFERIPDYISSSATAWVYDARNEKGELVAFDVAEMGPKHYAFYMFNFTSHYRVVPGASDLLLWEIILQAKREDKHYINLGLGINPGVTFFKEKWGGKPFLPYSFVSYAPAGEGRWDGLLQKL